MAEDVVWKGESHVNSIQQGWFERGMSLSHIASHWHHDNGMGSIVPSAPTHTLLVFLYWFGYEGGVPRKHHTHCFANGICKGGLDYKEDVPFTTWQPLGMAYHESKQTTEASVEGGRGIACFALS